MPEPPTIFDYLHELRLHGPEGAAAAMVRGREAPEPVAKPETATKRPEGVQRGFGL